MTHLQLPDAPARERMRSDHDTTLIVEAAAGTGKTTSVVSRVVEMVARGTADIGRIATITFTEKAGGELRLRIRQSLEVRLAEAGNRDPVVRRRLERAIASLEDATIGTIHSFCAALLGEYPVEAGVDPGFRILGQPEQRAFYDRVFRRFFEAQIHDPGPGIRRLLRRPSRNQWNQPVDLLRDAGLKLLEARDFEAPWSRPAWDGESEVIRLMREGGFTPDGKAAPGLEEVAVLYRAIPPAPPKERTRATKPNWLAFSMAAATALEEEIRLREEAGAGDPEWTEQALATLQVQTYGGYPPRGAPPDLRNRRDAFRARLLEFQKRSNADLAALLREDLRELVDLYEDAKRRAGVLDFHDLLARTRDLLRDSPDVRSELQDHFRQVVVDEYQDTDPIQTEIALLLTSDEPPNGDWRRATPRPGRLCLVGDPKQSIYRFRGADIAHYQSVKARLLRGGAVELNLTSNFRSTPGVCDFVNEVMEPLFEASRSLAVHRPERGRDAPAPEGAPAPLAAPVSYQPLHPTRGPLPGGPAVRAIPIQNTKARDAAREEPRRVAGFVGDLLDSGQRIADPERKGHPRPIRPGDICLLFRRFRSAWKLVPQPFAQELHERDIPYSLNTVRTYIGSAELTFLRAALTAIEFPEDEIAVYSTLRGPLFAVPDQDLFRFVRTRGRLRPHRAGAIELDASAPAADSEIRDALGFLFRLHLRRNERPIAVTLSELLGAHRAEIAFALWRSPEQVLTNLRRLLEEARLYEASGGLSFRGFVAQLDEEAQAEDASAGRAVDEETSGVRLMTIHAAKGLEFPVVVLCDVTDSRGSVGSRFVSRERNLWACDLGKGIRPWDLIENQESEIEEEKAEFDRMLYVAMTRARDILACPVAKLKYQQRPAFLDPPGRRLHEIAPAAAAGSAPTTAPAAPSTGASPPDRPTWRRRAVSRWRVLRSAGAEDAVRRGRAAEAAFVERRERALREGAEPERRVSGAKQLAEEGAVERLDAVAAEVAIEAVSRDPRRPGGAAFGTLVHRILESVRFGAPASEVEAAARRAVRELDLPAELASPAAAAALTAFDHPLLEAAARAEAGGRAWRELPLLHREQAVLPADGEGAAIAPDGEDSAFDPAPDWSALPALALEDGDAAVADAAAEPAAPADSAGPVMVQGIADLVFQEEADGPFTIVDFKTDAFDPDRPGDHADVLATYRRQQALYVRAISRATGKSARAALLFV